MRITDLVLKIKAHEHELFHGALLLVVTLGAFGLGYFAGLDKGRNPVKIVFPESVGVTSTPVIVTPVEITQPKVINNNPAPTKQVVVASKQGSKYHYPHCPGAKQIKETNQVWFNSPAEAETAGYNLAANCQPQ
ncbi:MAG: hypothetical protein HYV76_02150 [Candidatus Vogelbacteria bacterium]|nr:hypothetical protein [Candidatus Vogelbacteria bacterium]